MTERKWLLLENLSWTEVRDLLPGVDMVLIPTGSHEQHGPAMALKTDAATAAGICRLVAEKLYPRVMVAPAVPWGISMHHLAFPGTITLHPPVFIAVLKDIVSSLMHHGFERFLFVNGHGGNNSSLQVACMEIHDELRPAFIGSCYDFSMHKDLVTDDPELTGHGCQIEASYGLYLAPEIVKPDRFVPAEYTYFPASLSHMNRAWSIYSPVSFETRLPLGFKGEPSKGTYERGKLLAETVSDRLVEYIEALVAYQKDAKQTDQAG